MITLAALAALAADHAADIARPVAPLQLGLRTIDTDLTPVVMGTVNLSRDSTYRDSIAPSSASAIRRGRVLAAQGADVVDIGAESSTAAATRVDAEGQIALLVPVVAALSEAGVVVSAESYRAAVVEAALQAGAAMVNLTGSGEDARIFDLVAEHDATLVLCDVTGADVREISDVDTHDPFPAMQDRLAARLEQARVRGVSRLAVDPGMGFYYGNLTDPTTRIRHQTRVLLTTFRLRALGVPACHAVPHAFDLFEDQFRSAEGFFTVLATLGGAGIIRTHEVPQVLAVLRSLRELDVPGDTASGPHPG